MPIESLEDLMEVRRKVQNDEEVSPELFREAIAWLRQQRSAGASKMKGTSKVKEMNSATLADLESELGGL